VLHKMQQAADSTKHCAVRDLNSLGIASGAAGVHDGAEAVKITRGSFRWVRLSERHHLAEGDQRGSTAFGSVLHRK
jgi:hypothetical protein